MTANLEFKNSAGNTKDFTHNGKVYLRVFYRNLKKTFRSNIGGNVRERRRVMYIIRRHD